MTGTRIEIPPKWSSSGIDYLSVALTKGQENVVYSDRRDHLLVIAPPGSGKTLTITRRIAHLLGEGNDVEPEEIMALTFTERAANELITRLASMVRPGVYAGTFHSACMRILKEHASLAVGAKIPVVASDAQRRLLLREAANQTGYQVNDWATGELLNSLSRMKCSNLTIEEAASWYKKGPEAAQHIFDLYQQLLRDEGECDFDDLIIDAAALLWNDPEAAARVHNRYRYVFVDEYQDVSAEQYRFIRMLIPPDSGSRQLLVVADSNQAIFGFRGAFPDRMLDQLHQHYRPTRFDLRENHRSVGHIVRVARRLMHVSEIEEVSETVREEGSVVDWFEAPDDVEEAKLVARLVQAAIDKGRSPTDIAILYRRHKRADLIEQALTDAGIPVRRLRRERFFDDPDVQETIRYFELVAGTRDKSFTSAINWPRFLVDELTMINLRQIAAQHDLNLGELAESPNILRLHATPLTATQITRFMDEVVLPARKAAEKGAVAGVEAMLALLRRRRDPIPTSQRGNLRSTLDELGRHLGAVAELLDHALLDGRIITLVAETHPDCQLASSIVHRTLDDYFPEWRPARFPEEVAFVLHLGEVDAPGSARLTWESDKEWTVAAQAWRLMQMVLIRREKLHLGEFTLFDLETTSNVPISAQIMDIAGVRIQGGSILDDSFAARVRPSGPETITQGAQNVHGISWEMVKEAPTAEVVVPQFIAFAGSGIIAGHNIVSFDSRILSRECDRLGLPALTNYQLDTLQLARRLRPRQSNSLSDLLTDEEKRQRGTHEALIDAQLNARVLLRLLDELRREREIDVLTEALPLVGASIMVRQCTESPDNQLLISLAARSFRIRGEWYLPEDLTFATCPDMITHSSWLEKHFSAQPDDEKWLNLEETWLAYVDSFARIRTDMTLPDLLERVSLATVSDLDRGDRERVTMMTVYSAKGHEWPIVFMIGVEEGEYPYSNPDDSTEELKEARRAFYVGITRAQERLLLSSAWWVGEDRTPSPFVQDIRSLVNHRPPEPKKASG